MKTTRKTFVIMVGVGALSSLGADFLLGRDGPPSRLNEVVISPVARKRRSVTYYVDPEVVGGSGDGTSLVNAFESLSDVTGADVTKYTDVTVLCRGVERKPVVISGWVSDPSNTITIHNAIIKLKEGINWIR